MLDLLKSSCKTQKERELFEIIFFKQSKLKDYAIKHGISPQAANRQALVLRQKFAYILKKNTIIQQSI